LDEKSGYGTSLSDAFTAKYSDSVGELLSALSDVSSEFQISNTDSIPLQID